MIDNIYTWILFILCGILVVCYIHRLQVNKSGFLSLDEGIMEDTMKKRILSLFTGNRISPGNVQFTTLSIQTRPWEDLNRDYVVVKAPPYTEEEMKFPDTILSTDFIKQQQYDILRKKAGARNNDFFLEGRYGLDINIIFKYNYEGDFFNNVDVDAEIIERDPTDGKTLKFNKCLIDYNGVDPNRINLKLEREVTYTSPVVKTPVKVKQEFTIYLNINGLTAVTNFRPSVVIAKMTPYDSYMDYKISWQKGGNYETLYNIQLFVTNAKAGVIDANEYMKRDLEEQNKVILADKYNKIITPMFMVDNKISKIEESLQTIKDAYEFNRLNNAATQLRFYPNTQ